MREARRFIIYQVEEQPAIKRARRSLEKESRLRGLHYPQLSTHSCGVARPASPERHSGIDRPGATGYDNHRHKA